MQKKISGRLVRGRPSQTSTPILETLGLPLSQTQDVQQHPYKSHFCTVFQKRHGSHQGPHRNHDVSGNTYERSRFPTSHICSSEKIKLITQNITADIVD